MAPHLEHDTDAHTWTAWCCDLERTWLLPPLVTAADTHLLPGNEMTAALWLADHLHHTHRAPVVRQLVVTDTTACEGPARLGCLWLLGIGKPCPTCDDTGALTTHRTIDLPITTHTRPPALGAA